MNDLIPDTCPVYCRTLMRSNGMNSASEEYGSILRPLGRAAEQVQQYPKSLQCTPAIPLVEPMIASPKDQRKQSVLPRPQRKVELLNGQILSFSDIADFYSDCLPISTRVYGGGFYGVSGELTIGENETLYIHTALKVDVAIAEISHNRKYNIPVTFGVPFGIVYNPSNNAAAAIEGHLFESIESILSGKELPKIIRMECNTIDTAGCVVNCGEILIVKGSPAPMQLNVYNLSTGATSTLCKGSFSANPHLMKMSLQQIHQFAHDLLPCQVVLCCEDYPNVNPPSHLASCIFTIKEFKNTTTLLITRCLDADISKLKVMELPSNLQFQVQITGTDTWSSLAKTTKIISDSYPNLPDLYRYLGMPNEKMRQGQLFFYGVGSCSTSENDDFSSNNTSSENDYVVMNRPAGGPLSPSHGVLSHANTKDFPNECQNKQQEKESSTPGNDYITILPAAPVYQTIQSQLPQDSGSLPPPPQPKKRAQGAGSGSSTLPRTSPRYAEVSQVPTSVASSIPPAPRQVSSAQATSVAPRITPRPRPQVRSNELLGSVAKMSGSVPEVSQKCAIITNRLSHNQGKYLALKGSVAVLKFKKCSYITMAHVGTNN